MTSRGAQGFHCGGTASHVAQDGGPVDTSRSYRLNPARVISLVGMDIPEAEQRQTLRAYVDANVLWSALLFLAVAIDPFIVS